MSADEDIHGATTKRPPRGEPVVIRDREYDSYPARAGRWRWQLPPAIEKALLGAAVAIIAAASTRLTVPGGPLGPPKEEAAPAKPKPKPKKPKLDAEGEEKEPEEPPTNEELKEELDLLRAAVLSAEGRAKACVAVVNEQARFHRSLYRTVHGISIPIQGDPGEPPVLAVGPSPLSTKPFVLEVGPPKIVVLTPIPTVPKE